MTRLASIPRHVPVFARLLPFPFGGVTCLARTEGNCLPGVRRLVLQLPFSPFSEER